MADENRVNLEAILDPQDPSPVVDVRTAEEFDAGHIPGAVNLPLFDHRERAAIGLCYKQHGPQMAIKLGLEYCGPRLRQMVEWGEKHAPEKRIRVHCWRGGMRSSAVAWLWSFTGFETRVLAGGYKTYRRWALAQFEKPRRMNVLGGATGSGKTELLFAWKNRGIPILDLEGLARHKGSVFGNLGLPPQPTQEQFENDLALALHRLPADRPFWVEDESRHIGRLVLPGPFWNTLQSSPLFIGERAVKDRAARIAVEYGIHPREDLLGLIDRIEPRLGGLRAKTAKDLVAAGDLVGAGEQLLDYYDRAYAFGVEHRQVPAGTAPPPVTRLRWEELHPDLTAGPVGGS